MIMDTLNRLMRHFKPISKLNNKGFITINRDPDPEGNAGGGAGAGVAEHEKDNSGSGDGGEGPAWLEVFPEEAQKDPALTKYKTPDEFFKGYQNLQKMVGAKGLIVPKDDAPQAEKDAFLNAIGRPEKPEGYKFEELKDLDKSLTWDKTADQGLANLFHQRGIPQSAANALRNDFVGMLNNMVKQENERQTLAIQNAETALRKEWGDKFDVNKTAVAKLVLSVGGQEALDAMGGEKGLGNNPVVLKMFSKIANSLSEDQINTFSKGASKGSAAGNETKEQAIAKIKEMLNADKNHPLWNDNDPKHFDAVAEKNRLYSIAYPNEGA